MSEIKVYFSKVKSDGVIPNKDIENAGYDIYANFTQEYLVINPHTTVMIETGIASAFSDEYVMILKERGSTGTKGIAQRCGVIDSGFRNEWKVPINNTTNNFIIILKFKEDEKEKNEQIESIKLKFGNDVIIYPYKKAITQSLLLPVPKTNIEELPYEDLKKIESKRGMGMLGSSGK